MNRYVPPNLYIDTPRTPRTPHLRHLHSDIQPYPELAFIMHQSRLSDVARKDAETSAVRGRRLSAPTSTRGTASPIRPPRRIIAHRRSDLALRSSEFWWERPGCLTVKRDIVCPTDSKSLSWAFCVVRPNFVRRTHAGLCTT